VFSLRVFRTAHKYTIPSYTGFGRFVRSWVVLSRNRSNTVIMFAPSIPLDGSAYGQPWHSLHSHMHPTVSGPATAFVPPCSLHCSCLPPSVPVSHYAQTLSQGPPPVCHLLVPQLQVAYAQFPCISPRLEGHVSRLEPCLAGSASFDHTPSPALGSSQSLPVFPCTQEGFAALVAHYSEQLALRDSRILELSCRLDQLESSVTTSSLAASDCGFAVAPHSPCSAHDASDTKVNRLKRDLRSVRRRLAKLESNSIKDTASISQPSANAVETETMEHATATVASLEVDPCLPARSELSTIEDALDGNNAVSSGSEVPAPSCTSSFPIECDRLGETSCSYPNAVFTLVGSELPRDLACELTEYFTPYDDSVFLCTTAADAEWLLDQRLVDDSLRFVHESWRWDFREFAGRVVSFIFPWDMLTDTPSVVVVVN